MSRTTSRPIFRRVSIPTLLILIICVSYSYSQRPLTQVSQPAPNGTVEPEPTTPPTVIPKRFAILKKAAVPWGDEVTEDENATETTTKPTEPPYVVENVTEVSNSTEETTNVLTHTITDWVAPTKPTFKLLKVLDKKTKELKDVIKAQDMQLVTDGMIRVRNIEPKPDKDRRKTFKYTIGKSKTGHPVAKKVLRLLFNVSKPTTPEEKNEFYDYYEYDYYEYYNIDMDFITNPFFFNTDCNFEDDNCTWVFKPEWRNMTAYFQRVSGESLAKILDVDPEEYREYLTDWKNTMSGSYLWSMIQPGGESVYVWSDLYHYSKPACTLTFRTKSINLSRGEYSVVVDTLDENEIVVLEERGNNKNSWERWHVPIGGVRKPFRIYVEVNPPPSGKRIGHVFIDDLQLLNCFRDGPQDKECPSNMFKCSDTIKDFCFNSSYICDIHRDCISGKDEEEGCDKIPPYGRCSFEWGWCGWQNNPRAKIEWIKTIGRGNRSRRYMGPMYDHTLQNMHGKMLLANMSKGKDFADEAILDSAVFNPPPLFHSQEGPFKGLCRVRFYYFQYAIHPAALSLFVIEMTPKGEKSTQIWTTFGSKGDIWFREEAEVPKNVVHRYYLRFFAQRGTGGRAYIGLDDISLSPQCFGLHVPDPVRAGYNYSRIHSFGDMPSLSFSSVHKEFLNQAVYVFTTCGARGRLGPKPENCVKEYNNSNVNVTVMTTPSIDGYQKWTVPEDGYYSFIVSGASGGVGYDGKGVSLGSIVAGVIKLSKNQSVYFVIGQEGLNGCRKNYQFPEDPACKQAEPFKNETILSPFWLRRKIKIPEYKNDAGGGGGGTFVFLWNKKRGKIPLFIAAGGGGLGGGFHKDEGIQHGKGLDHTLEGTAGTQAGDWTGGAGAGWTGANGSARDVTGYGATHGAFGGKACNQETKLFGTGGFGGGGGGCRTGGGGGGFQGGSAHAEKPDGEGGYSYIAAGINYRRVTPAANIGPGKVMVMKGFKGCGCQFLCIALDETRTQGVCICPEGAELQSDLVSCRHYADKSRVDDIENSLNESKSANQFERIMSGAIGFLIVVILAAMCFYSYRINQRNRIELVTEKILRETDLKIRKLREEERNDAQIITTSYEIMGTFCTEKDLPELPRDEVELCEVIGKGAFGKVFTGYYKKREPGALEMPVAVKTLTKTCSSQEESDYYLEALIMSKFDHPNIVRLIGVCFDRHPRLIVLELLKGGDLRKFLREHRPTPKSKSLLSMIDLLRCALDVASGCVYLEQNRFIHRDIAARNCLLTRTGPGRVVKIADFGLARDCYRCDYYKKGGRTMLPVKWMPPEAFQDGIFSIKTDVWAYGVLLWEIFSLGFMPYQGLGNREVMNMVVEGGRMDPPENCPPPVYGLMLRCWMHDPAERPSFKIIRERIGYCLQDPEVIKTPFPSHSALPPPEEEPLMRPDNFDWDKFEAYCIPPRKRQSPGSADGASTSQAVVEEPVPSTSREDPGTSSSRLSFADTKPDRPRRSQDIELNDLCLEPDEIVVLETSFTTPGSSSSQQSAPHQSIQIDEPSCSEVKVREASALNRPEDSSRAASPKKETALSYLKDKLQQKKKALGLGKELELAARLPRITDNVEVVAERTYVKPKKKSSDSAAVPEQQLAGYAKERPIADQQTSRSVEEAEKSESLPLRTVKRQGATYDAEEKDVLPLESMAREEKEDVRIAQPSTSHEETSEGLPEASTHKTTPEGRGKCSASKRRVYMKKKSQSRADETLETINESKI